MSALRIRDGILWRELRGELIALDANTGRYYRLEADVELWRSIHEGRFGLDTASPGIRTFIESAVESGLLENVAESGLPEKRELGSADTVRLASSAPAIHVTRAGLDVAGSIEPLRDAFRREHYVRLPGLMTGALLATVKRSIEGGEFADRTHEGIGTEACLLPGIATSLLQLVFNDPRLLAFIAEITDSGPLGCFDGRVYRMSAGAGHYDSWHSDVGEDRRVALSLNVNERPHEGGVLEIRRAASAVAEWTVGNVDPGSAVLFRIAPDLRHRVSAVLGTTPRTAYAGWFRTAPDFQDFFFASLPNDA